MKQPKANCLSQLKSKIDNIRNARANQSRHVRSHDENISGSDETTANTQNTKMHIRLKSPQNEDASKTLQLPSVMLPIPNEKYDFYKPGVIVDILIIDVSEKSFNSQRIVNERVRADPSSTVKSLVVSVPLEPCSWIKSVKDLEHRTLRISITPKRLNLSKPIVRYFHFGDNDSLDLNKNKPEIAKQLPMLKVFLEHVRFTESNKKKINQFSPLKMIINNASAENSSNSSISKVDISEKSSDSKPNLLRHGKNFNINSDLNIVEQDDFYQHSRLKDKRYIDKIINSIRNVMEIKPSNIGKINANEKRNRFKRSCLSYDDLDSASNLYSTININQINRDIEQYEEEYGKQRIVVQY